MEPVPGFAGHSEQDSATVVHSGCNECHGVRERWAELGNVFKVEKERFIDGINVSGRRGSIPG